ncbi:hypothetical protein PR048_004859 [Dryococelus australis]|uniref:PiggyBac transposable element-derived protein domain-containing protein n=1 Tax=Dryococelus australis TaxID=614101 RepID=A0ABQ9I6K6_9NEOP|nr:hypothetical protein PR048_004859 [Dryococelus australis]
MTWSPTKFIKGRDGRCLLLHAIFVALEKDDEEEIPRSVDVSPPDEATGADSDEDFDNSNREAQGNLDRLPDRVLRSQVLVRYSNTADENGIEFEIDNTGLKNAAMDGTDSMYKVRPLFDHLNSAFKQISVGDSVSIDESMIPYFGHHSAKQFIRGKPIIFGFKLWVAADPSGYIFHVEPYCGTSTRFPTTGNGQGNDVVGLVDRLQMKKGTRMYFNNFFTSASRRRNLKSNGIGATGTRIDVQL